MLKDWIRQGVDKGASDVHLESGVPIVLRVRGQLSPVSEALSHDALLRSVQELLGSEGWQEFLGRRSADLSRTIAGARCRINVY